MFDPRKYFDDDRYDVGRIVRDTSDFYLRVGPPNRWTRVEAGKLLLRLDQLTDQLAQKGAGAGVVGGAAGAVGLKPSQMPAQWRADFDAWQERLAAYKKATRDAPQGHSHELWNNVGAPLLMGYYPGEENQRTADIATPFSLANQLEVDKEWREENLRRFGEELGDAAKKAGYGIGALVATGLAVAGAFFFFGRSS